MFSRAFLSILLIVSFSCGKSQDAAKVETIPYSVDSVVVDAKGEILFLEYGLFNSDYCQQDGFLYNYSVFDIEFKLLSEMPIPELNIKPTSKYFVKDGKLWVFKNQEDEMGFIVLDIHGNS